MTSPAIPFDEALGMIPHVLGFTPRDMIVVVHLAPSGDHLKLTRAHGASLGASEAQLADIAHELVNAGGPILLAVAYADGFGPGSEAIMHLDSLAGRKIDQALVVTGESWVSILDNDRVAHPLLSPEDTVAGARLILADSILRPHPLDGLPGLEALAAAQEAAADPVAVVEREMAAVRHVMATGAVPPASVYGRLARALEEPVIHSEIWKLATDGASVASPTPWLPSELLLDLGAPAPDHLAVGRLRDLVDGVAAHSAGTGLVPAWALSSLLTWWLAGDLEVGRSLALSAARAAGQPGSQVPESQVAAAALAADLYSIDRVPGWMAGNNAGM